MAVGTNVFILEVSFFSVVSFFVITTNVFTSTIKKYDFNLITFTVLFWLLALFPCLTDLKLLCFLGLSVVLVMGLKTIVLKTYSVSIISFGVVRSC